jgi:hypothetical protein
MAAAEEPDEIELFDFEASARSWDTLYDASDFPSVAYYQPRLERTLDWVDSLCLPVDARVLEVGFGAGRAAIALAQRGLRVTGIDTHEAMVELRLLGRRPACPASRPAPLLAPHTPSHSRSLSEGRPVSRAPGRTRAARRRRLRARRSRPSRLLGGRRERRGRPGRRAELRPPRLRTRPCA